MQREPMRKLRLALVSSLFVAACGGSGDPSTSNGEDSSTSADGTSSDDTASGTDTPSGTDTDVPGDTAGGTDTTTPSDASGDTALGPYPAGPYGAKEGDTITNLQWIGYVNDAADSVADTKPYVNYSLDDARRTGRKYLLLHVSDFA